MSNDIPQDPQKEIQESMEALEKRVTDAHHDLGNALQILYYLKRLGGKK